MAKHALKIAAALLALVVTMGSYWAVNTDNRLNTLEDALLTLARIEAKVDVLLNRKLEE